MQHYVSVQMMDKRNQTTGGVSQELARRGAARKEGSQRETEKGTRMVEGGVLGG